MPMSARNPIEYDAEIAERAWNDTQALREALGLRTLPRLDLKDVAILGLGISSLLRDTAIRQRFDLLPAELFDHSSLDLIATMSWALWHGNQLRLTTESNATAAKLSLPTLEAGTETKARMLRVVTYVLDTHPEAGPEVASIRAGAGHIDLASDLGRLGRLYTTYRTELREGGGKHYRAADETKSKELAAQILAELGLGESKALKDAKLHEARAYALLEQTYEPIRRFAHAIFPNRTDEFPSLWSVRASTPRPKESPAAPAETETDPQDVTP